MVRDLLVGQKAPETISALNTSLRSKTVSVASGLERRDFLRYVPWLCIRPVLPGNFEDPELMDIPLKKGALLNDEEVLERVSAFLNGQAKSIVDPIPADSGRRERFQVYTDIRATFPQSAALFRDGRSLLFRSSRLLSQMYNELIDTVVPLKRDCQTGVSSHLARGALLIALFEGYEVFDLALELAHETGHQALMVLQSTDDLIASPHDQPIYSGVRKSLRPAIQCLHASAALAYMIRFSTDLRAANSDEICGRYIERAEAQIRTDSEALEATLVELARSCEFTRLGSHLIAELATITEC